MPILCLNNSKADNKVDAEMKTITENEWMKNSKKYLNILLRGHWRPPEAKIYGKIKFLFDFPLLGFNESGDF